LIRVVHLVHHQVSHVKTFLIVASVMVKAVSQVSDAAQAKALIREQASLRVEKNHAVATQVNN
jgi:hypothetical protein